MTTMKELKEFRVFRENEHFNYEEDIVILRSQDIVTKNLCETYDHCCSETGCYALDSDDGMAVLLDILAEMKITLTEEEKKMDFEDLLEKYEKIEGYETAKEAVEKHVACECYEYWDGTNYRSIITKNWEADLREISDEEIIAEYNAVRDELRCIEGRDKTVNSGKHSFLTSRMQGFYPVAVVRDIEEEEEQDVMKEVRINCEGNSNTVSVDGATCTFYEAGLYQEDGKDIVIMSEIIEHLTEREGVSESQIIFELDLTDCEGRSEMMDVTLENGCICIWKDGVDITENFNIDGWTTEDGEYTIY